MNQELILGQVFEESRTVEEKDTAMAHGSGDLQVFATPAMVALMEYAAKELVKPALSPGETTVGVRMEVSHLKATGVGKEVLARAELTKIQGRKITCTILAYEGETLIGQAHHERVVVDRDKFMSRVNL